MIVDIRQSAGSFSVQSTLPSQVKMGGHGEQAVQLFKIRPFGDSRKEVKPDLPMYLPPPFRFDGAQDRLLHPVVNELQFMFALCQKPLA